jgi:hypothetical protein
MTPNRGIRDLRNLSVTQRLARAIGATFVLTFIVARAIVLLTAAGVIPEFHIQVGDTHVHHLNIGIFILAGMGGYLLLVRPGGRALQGAAVIYGVGLGLTFDEFGMWLHLEDVYWHRASFDAVVVISGLLALVIAGPALRRFRPREWATAAGLVIAVTLFGLLVLKPLWGQG